MTEEQEKRFKECIKVLPSKDHVTPESAEKSALEAAKTKKIKEKRSSKIVNKKRTNIL